MSLKQIYVAVQYGLFGGVDASIYRNHHDITEALTGQRVIRRRSVQGALRTAQQVLRRPDYMGQHVTQGDECECAAAKTAQAGVG